MNKELIEYNFPNVFLNVSTITFVPGLMLRGAHHHSAIELVRVRSGTLNCRIGDSSFHLSPYDTLLINKNIVHSIECFDVETKFSYIQIDLNKQLTLSEKDDTHYIYQFIDKSSPAQYYISSKDSQLSSIFDNIFNEFHSTETNTILYLRAYILQLDAFMHRYNLTQEFEANFLKKLDYIKPIIEYINNHYAEKIYIDDIALLINVNKFQLCKCFKSITGGTVVEYINFVRLQQATNLLLNSDKTITEIAHLCGFSSTQYFNKVFNQNYGCPPRKFRK